MSARFTDWEERTRALALDEVAFGLAPGQRAELVARLGPDGLEELEFAVAELHVAALGELEAPPAALTERIAADARAWLAAAGPAQTTGAPAPRARSSAAGWRAAFYLAAATALALFAFDLVPARPRDPAERRERLVASAADLVRATWKRSEDQLAGGLEGELVWSPARQEGYMSFRSLPRNDPARNQYQLWIFDSTRAEWEAKPVDGGVFDAGPDETVVVAIDAKLEVREAALFALTLEAPGGVVVSAREHLLATAQPSGG